METQIRTRFNEAWEAIVASKRNNKKSLSHQEYQDRLKNVRRIIGLANKSSKDCILLLKYDIVIKDGRERLVKPLPQEGVVPDQYPLYVTNEELFGVLHEAYIDTNHHRMELMYNRIRGRYCNVTLEAVVTYLKVRKEVGGRAISPEQGLLPMPPSFHSLENGITSVYFGFVDMHRYACDGYTCIMVHWDTVTRFTHMVPLKGMDHGHVAFNLLKIYMKVGIPNFIDAPYDRPYITSIVDFIRSAWSGGDCCITIRSSDDQEAIKTGWNTVQEMMEPWIANPYFQRNWLSKLKYIPLITNKRNFSGKIY